MLYIPESVNQVIALYLSANFYRLLFVKNNHSTINNIMYITKKRKLRPIVNKLFEMICKIYVHTLQSLRLKERIRKRDNLHMSFVNN